MALLILDDTLRSLIPPLTSEEYAQLEDNILADGCRDPLVVWEEEQVLLDGYNRHKICEKHGIEYAIATVSLPDMAAAQVWILKHQLGRRNLSDLDRVALARKLTPMIEEQAKQRQGMRTDLWQNSAQGLDTSPVARRSRDEIAALAGTSHDTVTKAEQILDHGTPALQQAVRGRQASIHAAATLATLPQDEQDAVVAQGKETMRDTAKALREQRRAERAAPEAQADAMLPLSLNGTALAPASATAQIADTVNAGDEAFSSNNADPELDGRAATLGRSSEMLRFTSLAEREDGWLARLLGQINRLAPLVDVHPFTLESLWADPSFPACSLFCRNVETVMDAVVARLTAPPVVVATPAPAVRSHHKPRKPAVSAPATGQVDRQGLILAQRAHFGTEPFTWKDMEARTELSYIPVYQGLGSLVKKGVIRKLTANTYRFTTPEVP